MARELSIRLRRYKLFALQELFACLKLEDCTTFRIWDPLPRGNVCQDPEIARLLQTTLSIAFVSSGLGSTLPGPSSETAVSLGVDWITSVHKWYLDHGCELLGDAFSLRDLLYPKPVAGASTAALATLVFNGPALNPPTPPDPSPMSGGSIPSIRARWK
ncbi:hypothetical protein B0H10DRAFT_2189162 [Mycena sp. CBHHK59/15]|nr:hypothetical protein B0H10DRAFT_2189162 [Mycena sp. CBHHK59/15]